MNEKCPALSIILNVTSGHTDKDSYSPPYVEIYANVPSEWKESKIKQELWRAENLKYMNRLLILLDEFYLNRTVIQDAQLHLSKMGIFGGFRLEAQGNYKTAEELGLKSQQDILNKIKLYQNEIKEFTNFIREKFLKNK